MRFFSNISDLDTLKKEFRRLSKIHHPDLGGTTANMQALLKEYESLKKSLEGGYTYQSGSRSQQDYDSWRREWKRKQQEEAARQRKQEEADRQRAQQAKRQKEAARQRAKQAQKQQENRKCNHNPKQTTLW